MTGLQPTLALTDLRKAFTRISRLLIKKAVDLKISSTASYLYFKFSLGQSLAGTNLNLLKTVFILQL